MKWSRPKHRTVALTLVEALVVMAVLCLLGAVLLPTLRPTRRVTSKRIICVNNLKQVGLSFRLWADDHNDKYPMQVSVTNGGTMELDASGIAFPTFQVMSNWLWRPKVLLCPTDTNRTFATNFTTDFHSSNISYFVALDADETRPNMLLSGDRNLATNGVPAKRGLLTLTTNSLVGWTARMHVNQGNIALADGHVVQLTTLKLQETLKNSGTVTNRLALP